MLEFDRYALSMGEPDNLCWFVFYLFVAFLSFEFEINIIRFDLILCSQLVLREKKEIFY